MPELDVDELFLSGRWQLALIVAGYFVVVYATNRVLITSPVARGILREVRQEEAGLAVLSQEGKVTETVAAAIRDLLFAAKRTIAIELPRLKRWQWRFLPTLTLAKVLTARRYLHGAQELRVKFVTEEHLALAHLSLPRLRQVDWPFTSELAKQLEALLKRIGDGPPSPQQDVELAVVVTEALKLWFAHDDAELDAAQDAQRRAMWLVCVGLGLVLTLGFAGHRPTLLFGALGGFLSPLTLVRQRAIRSSDYATSWGPILLSPVAGALTAFAGLLVLEFLSHEKIALLGAVFHDNAWSHPTTPLALAFAVLLGFSARLFSGLALAAVGAMNAKPSEKPEGTAAEAT